MDRRQLKVATVLLRTGRSDNDIEHAVGLTPSEVLWLRASQDGGARRRPRLSALLAAGCALDAL